MTIDNEQLTVREIEERDYPAVLALWNCLGNRDVTAENIGPYYEKVSLDDNYKTFVAVTDGETVGFITVVQAMSVGMPVGYLKINGLAVTPEMRNQGIGSRLLEHVEAYAKARGLSSIGLATGFKRKDAHRFYERHGYQTGSYAYFKNF